MQQKSYGAHSFGNVHVNLFQAINSSTRCERNNGYFVCHEFSQDAMPRLLITAVLGLNNFAIILLVHQIADFWHLLEQLFCVRGTLEYTYFNLVSSTDTVRDLLNVPRHDHLSCSNNSNVAAHLGQFK